MTWRTTSWVIINQNKFRENHRLNTASWRRRWLKRGLVPNTFSLPETFPAVWKISGIWWMCNYVIIGGALYVPFCVFAIPPPPPQGFQRFIGLQQGVLRHTFNRKLHANWLISFIMHAVRLKYSHLLLCCVTLYYCLQKLDLISAISNQYI